MGPSGPAPVPINPYESPGFYAVDSEVSVEVVQPVRAWRDDLLLVVPARGPLYFPAICIKTGRPLARGFTTPQTVASLPLGHALAKEKWPVSREWEEEIPLSQLLGMIVCTIGFLLFIASLALAAARVDAVITGPILALALFSTFTGLVMLALSFRVFLTAVEVQSLYVWLDGAHPDFLKGLPPWTAATSSRAK
jgi:hypothetical protein